MAERICCQNGLEILEISSQHNQDQKRVKATTHNCLTGCTAATNSDESLSLLPMLEWKPRNMPATSICEMKVCCGRGAKWNASYMCMYKLMWSLYAQTHSQRNDNRDNVSYVIVYYGTIGWNDCDRARATHRCFLFNVLPPNTYTFQSSLG